MNISTYVGGLIQTKAYRVLRAHVYRCLEKHQLNPTSWSLIGLINDSREGVRLAVAARTLGVKAPLITAMADELTKNKIIDRIADPNDQRAKLLVITSSGQQLVEQVEHDLATRLDRLLDGITAAEMATYHKVLLTIIKNDDELANG